MDFFVFICLYSIILYSVISFFLKTKLEVTIPNPKTTTISPKMKPMKGINPINHKAIEVTINIPKIPIVFSIFNK